MASQLKPVSNTLYQSDSFLKSEGALRALRIVSTALAVIPPLAVLIFNPLRNRTQSVKIVAGLASVALAYVCGKLWGYRISDFFERYDAITSDPIVITNQDADIFFEKVKVNMTQQEASVSKGKILLRNEEVGAKWIVTKKGEQYEIEFRSVDEQFGVKGFDSHSILLFQSKGGKVIDQALLKWAYEDREKTALHHSYQGALQSIHNEIEGAIGVALSTSYKGGLTVSGGGDEVRFILSAFYGSGRSEICYTLFTHRSSDDRYQAFKSELAPAESFGWVERTLKSQLQERGIQ